VEFGIARMFGVAKIDDYRGRGLPKIPEVVSNGFRMVTCLVQGNPEMEGHELSVGSLI